MLAGFFLGTRFLDGALDLKWKWIWLISYVDVLYIWCFSYFLSLNFSHFNLFRFSISSRVIFFFLAPNLISVLIKRKMKKKLYGSILQCTISPFFRFREMVSINEAIYVGRREIGSQKQFIINIWLCVPLFIAY